jgi:putative salt-induced outer membrane protein
MNGKNACHQIAEKFSFAFRLMKGKKSILVGVGILTAFSFAASAQTNFETVTNYDYVTVMVTNVVTVTNIVAGTNLMAGAPVLVRKAVPVPAAVRYPWESSVTAGLTLTSGNSHTLLYQGDFQTDKKTPKNEYLFDIGGAYGSQDSKDNINNYHASSQWNNLFTPRFYGYMRASALRDVILDLDYRFNIGPGVGYYLIKNTNITTLATEAGAGYQNEHLGGVYNSFATLRLAENFEHKIDDHARLWQNVELLPQADEVENFLVNFEIGLDTPITKSLSLNTCFDDNYANHPADHLQKNDMKVVSGLTYKF